MEDLFSLIAATSSLSKAMSFDFEALFKVSGRYVIMVIKLTMEKELMTRLGNR